MSKKKKTMNHVEFVMLVGISNSGKSTYYNNKYRPKGYTCYNLSCVKEKYCIKFNQKAYLKMCELILNDLSAGISVVVDDCNLIRYKRKSLATYIKQKSKVTTKCVLLMASLSCCLCRSIDDISERLIGYKQLSEQIKMFDCPYYHEGFDSIDIVSSDRFLDCDLGILKQINFFELDSVRNRFSLGRHMEETANYITDNYSSHKDYHLIFEAALNHDIGKMFTRTDYNSCGLNTGYAHYYNHAQYGSYVYILKAMIDRDRYGVEVGSSIEDILFISMLIRFHMEPYHDWGGRDNCERHRKLFGDRLFSAIEILHMADVSSH